MFLDSIEQISEDRGADGDSLDISCRNLEHRGDWCRFQSLHDQNHKHLLSPLAEYPGRIESDDGAARRESSAQPVERRDL